MTTIGAALLAIKGEEHETCLTSLSGLDTIYLLTDEPRILRSAHCFGATASLVKRPETLEEIGARILALAKTDWLLLIDPDERLICTDPAALREWLSKSDSDVVGYAITYRMTFLGRALSRTYRGLRKTKLVRPSQVEWPGTLHSLPKSIPSEGRFLDLPESTALIETEMILDVSHRLARHALWASVEAREAPAVPLDSRHVAQDLADIIQEYFEDRRCEMDDMPGILNGLLHINKCVSALLFRAASHGFAEDGREEAQALCALLRETAASLKNLGKVPI